MTGILGIDPGLDGGMALLEDATATVDIMPTTEHAHPTKTYKRPRGKEHLPPKPVIVREIDGAELAAWLKLRAESIDLVLLEEPLAMQGQARFSQQKAGRNVGIVEGVLQALRMPYRMVRSKQWSDEFDHEVPRLQKGASNAEKQERKRRVKDARRAIVRRIFPGLDLRESEGSQTEHEGITDALLLAEWGRRQIRKGNL